MRPPLNRVRRGRAHYSSFCMCAIPGAEYTARDEEDRKEEPRHMMTVRVNCRVFKSAVRAHKLHASLYIRAVTPSVSKKDGGSGL